MLVSPRIIRALLCASALLTAIGTGGCRASGGASGDEATLKSSGDPLGDPVVSCANTDAAAPKLDIDVYQTGFDPQQGTEFEVRIHQVSTTGSADIALNGRGSFENGNLEVVFAQGRLNAAATPPAKTFLGDFAIGEAARPVSCQ